MANNLPSAPRTNVTYRHRSPLMLLKILGLTIVAALALGEIVMAATSGRILIDEERNKGAYPYSVIDANGATDSVWPNAWECTYFSGKDFSVQHESADSGLASCAFYTGPLPKN